MASDLVNDGEVILNVELVQESPEVTEINKIRFSSRPTTFRGVKEEIEELFFIPTCVQTLRYEGNVVADGTTLESLYLQSCDSIQVHYPAKGAAIGEIKHAIDWLSKCSSLLEINESSQQKIKVLSLKDVSTFKNRAVYMFLTRDMFATAAVQYVNCRHFDYLGGLEVLIKFHNHLIETRSRQVQKSDLLPLHHFERLCCTTMARFCMNEYFAGRIVKCGGLQTLIASFLSFPADSRNWSKRYSLVIIEALLGIFKWVLYRYGGNGSTLDCWPLPKSPLFCHCEG